MASVANPAFLDIAVVTPHPSHKVPPTLGPGKITPAILIEWEENTQHFFTKDRMDPQNQVMSILSSFTHPSIKNWIAMNKDDLRNEDYTFNMFIVDLHKNFLDPQWINQILRNVIYACMAENENFEAYANRVLSGNNLLAGTDNHLPKAILRDTIENHLAEYLSLKIDSLPSSEREHMVQIETLEDWLVFMRRLDDSARAELQRYKNLTTRKRGNDENQEDVMIKRSRALPSTTDTTPPTSQTNNRPPFSTTQHNHPSYQNNRRPYASGTNALPYTGRSRVPRLTDDEREILELHHGCKKC